MNMIKLLLVMFAIEITLLLTGVAPIPGTSLLELLKNPSLWDTSTLIATIGDLFLTTGLGIVIVGATIVTRSDIFIFAGLSTILLSFVAPLITLFALLQAQTGSFILPLIFVGPLILIYPFVVIAWWRSRA